MVPAETILIENPLAVTEEAANADAAKAFLDFLYTPEAQAIFVSEGYRPVVDGAPAPTGSRRRRTCSRSPTWAAGNRSTTSSSLPTAA